MWFPTPRTSAASFAFSGFPFNRERSLAIGPAAEEENEDREPSDGQPSLGPPWQPAEGSPRGAQHLSEVRADPDQGRHGGPIKGLVGMNGRVGGHPGRPQEPQCPATQTDEPQTHIWAAGGASGGT